MIFFVDRDKSVKRLFFAPQVTTKVVKGTFSPVWNETFTFEVDMAHQGRCTLRTSASS